MKISTTLLLIFSLVAPFTVFAQLSQDTRQNLPTAEQYQQIKKYDAVVKFQTKKILKGVIYKVTNEAIILLPKSKHIKRYSHFEKLTIKDQKIIALSTISKVTTRESGKLRRNFWRGVGIGAGVGLGLLAVEMVSDGTGYFIYGVAPLALAGGLLGTIISIPIKSHNPKDKAKMEKLKKMAIMHRY